MKVPILMPLMRRLRCLKMLGAVLSIDHWECEELARILPQVLCRQVSQAIIDKHVFHFDCAGRVAAEQILELYCD